MYLVYITEETEVEGSFGIPVYKKNTRSVFVTAEESIAKAWVAKANHMCARYKDHMLRKVNFELEYEDYDSLNSVDLECFLEIHDYSVRADYKTILIK